MAVPFFVIAAQFMERGGIAKSLIDLAEAWLGWLRGGLALTCVGATTIFAAVSGSSVATALAMAASRARALSSVSRHSASGRESATMPPPLWR